jgi:hypothetical protein
MRIPIEKCAVAGCAYNQHGHCHAVTVEIGKDSAPCESFTRSVMFNVNPRFQSQVNSCRMSDCVSNRLSGCTRESVTMGETDKGGACLNYANRSSLERLDFG